MQCGDYDCRLHWGKKHDYLNQIHFEDESRLVKSELKKILFGKFKELAMWLFALYSPCRLLNFDFDFEILYIFYK